MQSPGIRITAGELRGKTIAVPPGNEVRPMRSRVRESLFSILGDRVRGARVLDVFAGSGSLSIEALSRGASTAVLVETAPKVLEVLRQNLARLNLSARTTVVTEDAYTSPSLEAARGQLGREAPGFDLIVIDPPFPQYPTGAPWALAFRLAVELLRPRGALALEYPAGIDPPTEPDAITLVARKKYGDTQLGVWEEGRNAPLGLSPDGRRQ
ncbi:MAG: 16S rRNA (guanine(966)-N(2))-methyltransferase RsmD [Planctomycetota bacterium]